MTLPPHAASEASKAATAHGLRSRVTNPARGMTAFLRGNVYSIRCPQRASSLTCGTGRLLPATADRGQQEQGPRCARLSAVRRSLQPAAPGRLPQSPGALRTAAVAAFATLTTAGSSGRPGSRASDRAVAALNAGVGDRAVNGARLSTAAARSPGRRSGPLRAPGRSTGAPAPLTRPPAPARPSARRNAWSKRGGRPATRCRRG